MNTSGACDLDSVIALAEFNRRPARPADSARETQVTLGLMRELSVSPEAFYQKLAAATLDLLPLAGSSGISLLDADSGRFVWPAIAGHLHRFVHEGTPRDFGPCGTVLDRDQALLFQHPERFFDYLIPLSPPLEEVLIVPFYVNGTAVGTLWSAIHEIHRQFDPEDKRLLESLSKFAASAYETLAGAGALMPLIRRA